MESSINGCEKRRQSRRQRQLRSNDEGAVKLELKPKVSVSRRKREYEKFPDPRQKIRDPNLVAKLHQFLEDIGTDPDSIDFTDSYPVEEEVTIYEPKFPEDVIPVNQDNLPLHSLKLKQEEDNNVNVKNISIEVEDSMNSEPSKESKNEISTNISDALQQGSEVAKEESNIIIKVMDPDPTMMTVTGE